MPHFFLHLREGSQLIRDLEGYDLPDLKGALAEAELAARDLVADRVRRGQPINDDQFEIATPGGKTLATFPLRAAVRLVSGKPFVIALVQ